MHSTREPRRVLGYRSSGTARSVEPAEKFDPAVVAGEPAVLARRAGGLVTAIVAALDHQRRRPEAFDAREASGQGGVPRVVGLTVEEAGPIGIERDPAPVADRLGGR